MKNYLNLVILTSIASTASCVESDDKNSSNQPNRDYNIVLINIDDLGWKDLGFQGSDFYETPNIDRLRAKSMFFSSAYASASNSAPSRASLMSGQYTPRHGVYTVNPANQGKESERMFDIDDYIETLPSKNITLAQSLKDIGYTTCHIGKWHLGEDATKQGMDINIAGSLKGHTQHYFSPYSLPNIEDGEDGEYLTDRLASEVIDFISKHKDKPFFLNYATYSVHTPLQPKAELLEKYENKPKGEVHNNAKYAAMIECVDTNIGKVVEHIEKLGLAQKTVIILTTDNGGVYDISKQWPLRAGKGSAYEGGMRVPMMIRWDGVVEPNSTSSQIASHLDIYPTLMSITNHTPKDYKLDGIDLSPILKGEKNEISRELFWHFPAYLYGGNIETTDSLYRSRPVSVVRKGDWKLIYNYESQKMELYNIKDDISEKNNLAEINSVQRDIMYKELQRLIKETNAPTEFKQNSKYINQTSKRNF